MLSIVAYILVVIIPALLTLKALLHEDEYLTHARQAWYVYWACYIAFDILETYVITIHPIWLTIFLKIAILVYLYDKKTRGGLKLYRRYLQWRIEKKEQKESAAIEDAVENMDIEKFKEMGVKITESHAKDLKHIAGGLKDLGAKVKFTNDPEKSDLSTGKIFEKIF